MQERTDRKEQPLTPEQTHYLGQRWRGTIFNVIEKPDVTDLPSAALILVVLSE
jgi:hypothetical protein